MPALFSFRPIARADFPQLGDWLREPHVARWWDDDASPEGLEEMYGGCVDGTEPAEVFIALSEGRPRGLAQRYRIGSYPASLRELETILPVPPGTMSIDYLLGAPVGQGQGTRLIRDFVARLRRDYPACPGILVPVHAQNAASWRALEKSGFVRRARGELAPDNEADSRDHFIYGAVPLRELDYLK